MGASIAILVFAAILAVVLCVAFLHRFFRKASPETALVRTGAGGSRVVIDGGCLVLPFLHHARTVSMRAIPITIALTGPRSVITSDRLRANLEMQFLARISPTREGVAVACQAMGASVGRPEEVAAFVEGHFVDAVQAVAAGRSLNAIHEERQDFATEVRRIAEEVARHLGLELDAASITSVDQAAFAGFDENNAFNSAGMRRLAEIVSEDRRRRAEIESGADIAIRMTELEQARRRIEIDNRRKQFEADSRRECECMEAETRAGIERAKAEAERDAARTRIAAEQATKTAEIERDEELRRCEMEAILGLETRKADHAVAMSAKRAEEAAAEGDLEFARAAAAEASEAVQTARERAAALRANEIALLKARQEGEVEAVRTRARVATVAAEARAESEAARLQTETEKERLLAESEGKRAQIEAENLATEALMAMKVEMRRLDQLPDVAAQMMKPVEKIDSIRINQIGGTVPAPGSSKDATPFEQALNSVLGMAVHLPAMKSLGAEIGLDFDPQAGSRFADAAGRIRGAAVASGPADPEGGKT